MPAGEMTNESLNKMLDEIKNIDYTLPMITEEQKPYIICSSSMVGEVTRMLKELGTIK